MKKEEQKRKKKEKKKKEKMTTNHFKTVIQTVQPIIKLYHFLYCLFSLTSCLHFVRISTYHDTFCRLIFIKLYIDVFSFFVPCITSNIGYKAF